MLLIEKTIPKEYEHLTAVFGSSTDKIYVIERQKKVKYYGIDFSLLIQYIKKTLEMNEEKNFLNPKEKKFLNFALKVFTKKQNTITINDYIKLMQLSLESIVFRLYKVKKELVNLMKKTKFEEDTIDDEYLFVIQNILSQLCTLNEEVKEGNWRDKDRIYTLSKQAQSVFRSINEVVLNIVNNQHENVKITSNNLLKSMDLEFHFSNKIIA